MSKQGKWKRKQYIVNPDFQWSFMLAVFQMEATVFVLGGLLVMFLDQLMFDSSLMMSSNWVTMVSCFGGLFVICFGYFFLEGLRFSNRVSGPLFRMAKALESLQTGAIPEPVKFREKDYHGELADLFNNAVAVWKEEREAQAKAWIQQAQEFHALAKDCEGDLSKRLEVLAEAAEAQAKAA